VSARFEPSLERSDLLRTADERHRQRGSTQAHWVLSQTGAVLTPAASERCSVIDPPSIRLKWIGWKTKIKQTEHSLFSQFCLTKTVTKNHLEKNNKAVFST
jgi:hypothetical protein